MRTNTLKCILLFLLSTAVAQAQNSVGIGTENSNNNAVLELVSPSNNQGFLVPRLTTSQRTATSFTGNLGATENGLLVYDSDEDKFYYWHDGQWQPIKNGPDLTGGTGISIVNGVITNTGDTDASDDFSGDFADLINVPSGLADGDNVDDADADPTNEIQDLNLSGNTLTITNNASATAIDLAPFSGTNTDNQTLSLATDQLSITGGNTVDLSSLIDDADADPSNELQTLSLSTNDLTLSDGGGTVTLFSGDFSDLSGVPANLDTDATDDFDGAFSSLSGVPTGLNDGDDVGPTYTAGAGIDITGGVITSIGDIDGSDDFDGDFNSLSNIPAGLSDGDDNTTYSAGTGISLSGTTIINTGDTDASDDFDGAFGSLTGVPVNLDTDATDDFDGAFSSLSGIPSGLSDGDDNTTYSAGAGITLSGTTIINTGDTDASDDFDGAFGSLTGVPVNLDTDATDDFDGAFSSLSGIPAGLSDGDDNTTYSAGAGITLSGTTIINTGDTDASDDFDGAFGSLTGVPVNLDTDATDDFDGAFSSLSGIPAGLSDGDDNTTYSAGAGITLSGTTIINTGDTDASDDFDGAFSSLTGVPVNLDTDATDDFDGAFSSLSGIPAGLSDGDDVNDADNSTTNELQNLSSTVSGTNRTINISGGTGTTISVADSDNSSSNEIQSLSRSGNTISISSGNSVDVTDQIGFRAGKSSDQGLSSGSTTVISFDTEGYDIKDSYDGASVFQAPVDGIYNFSGLISFVMDGGVDVEIYILVEGNPVHAIVPSSSSGQNTDAFSFTADLRITAGDRVQIAVNAPSSSGTVVGKPVQTNWSGRLIMNLEG